MAEKANILVDIDIIVRNQFPKKAKARNGKSITLKASFSVF
jgi:hypothetical protein